MKRMRGLVLCLLLCLTAVCGTVVAEEKEPLKIRLAFWGSNNWGDDAYYDYLCERFNVEFDFISLEWADWTQQLQMWAVSGDMPDVSACPLPSSIYFQFASQGVLTALPEDLSAYPTLNAYLDKEIMELFKVDGGNYIIPRANSYDFGNGGVTVNRLVVRKDWVAQAGYAEVPDNYRDFFEMCAKFAELKLGGDGTVGLAGTMNEVSYAVRNGMATAPTSWVRNADGVWESGMLTDENMAWIQLLQEAYQAGAIDTDLPLYKSYEEPRAKFFAGKAGVVQASMTAGDWENFKVKFEKSTGLSADDCLMLVGPAMKNDEGVIQSEKTAMFGTGTCFGAGIAEEKMTRMLEIIEYLLSDEGLLETNCGIEGTDYTYEDGAFVSLMPVNEETGAQYTYRELNPTASIGALASWQDEFAMINPAVPEKAREEFAASARWLEENAVYTQPSFEIDFWENEALTNWSTADYLNMVMNIIVSGENVEEGFAALRAEMLANGGQAAMDAVNENF